MVVVVRGAATVEEARVGALVEGGTREEKTAVERGHLRGAKVAYSEAMMAEEARRGETKVEWMEESLETAHLCHLA